MLALNIWQALGLLLGVIIIVGLAYFLGVEAGRADRDGTRIKI